MRILLLAVLFIAGAGLAAGCNDLTEPLPVIRGTYRYESASGDFPTLNRLGTITIVDQDRRTARFDGDFEFTVRGQLVTGKLTGAYMNPDRIWFRFLNEKFEYHEADLNLGRGHGEIFVQGFGYVPTGASFTLELLR